MNDQTPKADAPDDRISKSEAARNAATVGLVGTSGGGIFAYFLFDRLNVASIISQNLYGPAYALAILCLVAGVVLFGAVFLMPSSAIQDRKVFLGAILAVFAVLMIGSAFPFFFNSWKNPPVTFHAIFEPDVGSQAYASDIKLQPWVREADATETDLSRPITVRQGESLMVTLKQLDVLMQRYAAGQKDIKNQTTRLKGLQSEISAICLSPDQNEKGLCRAYLDQMSSAADDGVTSE
jgi:hypothetical protein